MSDLVTVGRVGKPHGLDGGFFVDGASERPEVFAEGATLYAGGEPATVLACRRGSGGRPVIRLDRAVERGAELAVPREALPPPEENEWYAFDLVGLQAVEEGGRVLGRVTAVEPGVANDVLVLEDGTLLPFVEACVGDVD
ncbi:MAG TPA: ribosome maturation factor RimM, partial [Gaiellaceae bacterium]|nr:ribosome maturation factor RimM [Gaiellaceae bacterium]